MDKIFSVPYHNKTQQSTNYGLISAQIQNMILYFFVWLQGKLDERKPLLVLFSEEAMSIILQAAV